MREREIVPLVDCDPWSGQPTREGLRQLAKRNSEAAQLRRLADEQAEANMLKRQELTYMAKQIDISREANMLRRRW